MGARAAIIVRAGVAAALVLVALDGGGYRPVSRGTLAIVVWWTLALLVATALAPRSRPTRGVVAVGALLGAFAAFTLASVAWTAAPEKTLAEFNRISLYLGTFALAVVLAGASSRALIVDGLALGIVAVGVLALASRFFPDVLAQPELPSFLPAARARLSYPVGYWNGLAMLCALAVPLLLRSATAAPTATVRGLAVAPLPALVSVVYLASSRGGALVGITGALAFVVATSRRTTAIAALVLAAAGSSAAISILVARPELVDAPLASESAAAQGRSAAALLLIVCASTGLVYALATRVLPPRVVVPSRLTWAAAAVALTLVLAAVVAIEPVAAFRTFKEPPRQFLQPQPDFVRAHLLSGGGSGRWQFWTAAVEEFESRPLTGRGAGSYEAWWAQHGSLAYFVRDAHSLYVEVLGELGLVGFMLLFAALVIGFVAGVHAVRTAPPSDRDTFAAVLAAFASFMLAVGIDWMWELTVVSLVGITCLGLLVSSPNGAEAWRSNAAVRIGVAAAAVLGIVLQAGPLLAELQLRASQASIRRGDVGAARDHAVLARNVEPWAATPYLQLALVEEEAGEVAPARLLIEHALERDRSDWRLWLTAARLHAKAGATLDARRSLARARSLNPRSSLFANSG